jgi:hypothetical protein
VLASAETVRESERAGGEIECAQRRRSRREDLACLSEPSDVAGVCRYEYGGIGIARNRRRWSHCEPER